jgi:hypothetical protein
MAPEARIRAHARTTKMLAEMALADVLGFRFAIHRQRARRGGTFRGR